MKLGIIASLSIAIVWAAAAVVQLWVPVMSAEVFMKVSITAGILIALIMVVTLAIREYLSEKDMKSRGFID